MKNDNKPGSYNNFLILGGIVGGLILYVLSYAIFSMVTDWGGWGFFVFIPIGLFVLMWYYNWFMWVVSFSEQLEKTKNRRRK